MPRVKKVSPSAKKAGLKEAVIVSAVRTAVGKAPQGTLKNTRPDELGAIVLKEAIKRAKGLKPEEIDDIIFGCAFPEGEQGMNVARVIGFRAGLPYTVPAITVNRFCSSGLQSITIAAEKIMCGFADVVVAGGVESMSMVPLGGNKITPNPYLVDNYPESYTTMGLTAEIVAERFNITREEQDKFALRSHQNAMRAIKEGRFKDQIIPVTVTAKEFKSDGTIKTKEIIFDTDEGVRYDTSLEGLAKLKAPFRQNGTVTAGNSSQTSDAAAALVVMSSQKAKELNLKPLAVFRAYAVGGVAPEIMGTGPAAAIPKVLKLAGLTLDQIDLFELNEAFASQSIYVINKLGLPPEKVNVNGGAIAMGHPLGCTGAKLTTQLLYEMERQNLRYGMVTMCIGGGMGAAGVFERVK